MTLYTQINLFLRAHASKVTNMGTGQVPQQDVSPQQVAKVLTWQTGTAADQADRSYSYVGALSGSAVLSLDLSAGGLVDAFGDSLTFARLKMAYVENTSPAGGASILLGGTLGIVKSGQFLRPGECLLRAVGDATAWAVANSSSDSLTVTNASSTDEAGVRLLLVGSSA